MTPIIESYFVYEHMANEYVLPHSHNSYEMVFYRSGTGVVNFKDEAFDYTSNSVVIMKPHELHNETNNTYTKVYIMNFSLTDDTVIENVHVKLNKETADIIYNLFEMISKEYQNQDEYYQENMTSMFDIILKTVIRIANDSKAKADDNIFVNYAKKYILENCMANINFEMLAKTCNYSYDRFRHLFKEKTGKSLTDYYLDSKIALIKEDLADSSLMIRDIANKYGFKSDANFVSFFSSRVGISPNKYRLRASSKIAKDLGVLSLRKNIEKNYYSYIFDTDMCSDCDDVGALALLNMFKKDYGLNVLCVTYSVNNPLGPAAIDIVNQYFGNSFEIGKTSKNVLPSRYLDKICMLSTSKYSDYDSVEDAVSLIRRKLYQAPDKSVKFICTGFFSNVSDLLDSKADIDVPLSGIELVKAKVKEFIIMAGMFNDSGKEISYYGSPYLVEYNVACDVKSAQNFIEKCPVDVIFSDFIIGYQVMTFGPLIKKNQMDNPITCAYVNFGVTERESWDPITMWYGINDDDSLFEKSNPGRISIDDKGNTVFKVSNKAQEVNHYYLKRLKSIEETKNAIDEFVMKHLS